MKGGAVVIGQEATAGAALFALFSRGQCLVVGVHGLAALLVQSLLRLGRMRASPHHARPR